MRDYEMKQFQKRFIKEVIAEATVLCTPIVPLAFPGPGRTRRMPDDHIAAARFRQEHSISKADEEDIGRRRGLVNTICKWSVGRIA
jgi:hypothetical protein